MHIIGSRDLGGAESFYLRLVSALAARKGHEAIAVTRRGGMLSEVVPNQIERHVVPLRNGWDILSAMAIRRLVRELRPDIVQTYMGRGTRLTRLPNRSASVHVARLGGFYKIDGYYRHADAWVGNTTTLCDYLIREGLPARRVHRIGNFVDIPPPTPAAALAALRRTLEIAPEAIVLFSLGRFIEKKGFADLIAAFASMPHEIGGLPLILVLAGDGPLRKALQSQAKALNVGERVKWVGWQTQPSPYFHLADVFVCPSRDEPLGNVILEAWAHGLPVVSTATVGAHELISPGENALVVDIGNPAALAGSLAELLGGGTPVWQSFAQCGRQALQCSHGKAAVVDAYLAMYENLLGCQKL